MKKTPQKQRKSADRLADLGNWIGQLSAVALLVACGDPASSPEPQPVPEEEVVADSKADGTGGGLLHTSMSSVEALKGDLSSIDPPIDSVFVGGGDPAMYLREMSCLGYYGPIGPYGPLGLLGPVGDAAWNPSNYVSGDVDWNVFTHLLDENDGPLTEDGPLGPGGPLNTDNWGGLGEAAADQPDAKNTYSDDFVVQLAPGGLWSVLGPIGPLGALGPLGPLGPVGAHGYATDDAGNYVPREGECKDGGTLCRTYDVQWQDEVRTYELFESYPEKVAAEMPDNDTSFMAVGAIEDEEKDAYRFTSHEDQTVTVTLVPHYARFAYPQAMTILYESSFIGFRVPSALPFYPWVYSHTGNFDDFDLTVEVVGADGEVKASAVSNSASRVDWVQFKARAGDELRARVELYKPWWQLWRTVDPEYRLIVVGSTPYVRSLPILGDHAVQ